MRLSYILVEDFLSRLARILNIISINIYKTLMKKETKYNVISYYIKALLIYNNNMLKPISNLPFDILNIILEYDGRIKFLHKKRIYVNIISKNDYRYNILETKIKEKIYLINTFNNGLNYYIDIFYKNDLITKGLIFSKKML